jgi:hypothetical protein
MSFVSRPLQCGLAVIVLRLYISTVFEQQPHNLQRPIDRGPVQRGPAAPYSAHLYLHHALAVIERQNRLWNYDLLMPKVTASTRPHP